MSKKIGIFVTIFVLFGISFVFFIQFYGKRTAEEMTSEERKKYILEEYDVDLTPAMKLSNEELTREEINPLMDEFMIENLHDSPSVAEKIVSDPQWQAAYFEYISNLYRHSNKFSKTERIELLHSELLNVWAWILDSQSYYGLYNMKNILEAIEEERELSSENIKRLHTFIEENLGMSNNKIEEEFRQLIENHSEEILKDIRNTKEHRRLRIGIYKFLGFISMAERNAISCKLRKKILETAVNGLNEMLSEGVDLRQTDLFGIAGLKVLEYELNLINDKC